MNAEADSAPWRADGRKQEFEWDSGSGLAIERESVFLTSRSASAAIAETLVFPELYRIDAIGGSNLSQYVVDVIFYGLL